MFQSLKTAGNVTALLFQIALMIFALSEIGYGQENRDTKTLVISAIENEQTHEIAKEVLHEAYRRIGYAVTFDFLPAKRALEWADEGKTDGDVARIDGTEKKFSHLVQIPTPVIYFTGVAFVKTLSKEINEWNDLKGLNIGVIRGVRYSTIGTEGMNPFFANDMTHLFKLLDNDRIQVAVAVREAGMIELNRNFRDKGIHIVGKPLHSSPLYHFIHSKNKHLADKLDKVLKDMEKNGEIERICKSTLEKLLMP